MEILNQCSGFFLCAITPGFVEKVANVLQVLMRSGGLYDSVIHDSILSECSEGSTKFIKQSWRLDCGRCILQHVFLLQSHEG